MEANISTACMRPIAVEAPLRRGDRPVDHPAMSWLRADLLNQLIEALDVQVIGLSECLVGPGHGMDLNESSVSSFHYVQEGHGKMIVQGEEEVEIGPHTLIIVPPRCPFKYEVEQVGGGSISGSESQEAAFDQKLGDATIMICGKFRATYSDSIEIFDTLTQPIVEKFSADDMLQEKLKLALSELTSRSPCSETMVGIVMKQVIVALIRRSLASPSGWVRRFAMLNDPPVAAAFAEMLANPGANHTTSSLAEAARLSRSAFMTRFNEVMGQPPMVVLHDLRMQVAATRLMNSNLAVGEIAKQAHYESPSSFARAFRKAFGLDPTEYRKRNAVSQAA